MNEIIKYSTDLFYEIDGCITKMIKAQLDKDADKEREVFCEMSTLLVNTMQYISWLVGTMKECSLIKWQTGEPKSHGRYLIQTKYDGLQIAFWSPFVQSWSLYNNSEIIAWCKLSDIGPYKEE